ncbi:MAG TPA: cobalamin-dependent protein [Roseiflexaceae bacterium]|nr:cobalamin-dependent protein [Roseiflexaceae bacterium]
MDDVYQEYLEALRRGDRRGAQVVARAALARGADIRDLYMHVFQPALYEVGRLWEANQFTVAQEHLATAITQSIMAQLAGELLARPPLGRTLLATCIGGEHHEVGIRMVSDFFELEGWDVIYLGANVPIPDVVQMVASQRADLLAISVTLSGHVTKARDLIAAVRASPSGARCRIMVGGQPFVRSPDLCTVVGADFTACDARQAVQRAQKALAS